MDGFQADMRCASLPCVMVASLLQYVRFAKKPMAEPFHRITDRIARRCVFVGLAAEFIGLWLLPLCQAYPMNASCLVCLFFWKETKRSRTGWNTNEVLACATALSAWILPFVDPLGGQVPSIVDTAALLDVLLAPRTGLYVTVALAVGVAVHCWLQGESALGSVAGPAINFGVSAIFLKALVLIAFSIAAAPLRPSLWVVAVALAAVLLFLRSATSPPLRRALEAHDKLTVLATYGVTSSAAAALTGGFVYRETDAWSIERQVLSFALCVAHCWGMSSLAVRSLSSDGGSKGVGGRGARDGGKGAVQLAEMSGRGSKHAVNSDGRPPSPLLNFSPSARTVDEDAQMEDQLLAHALAPQNLSPLMGWASFGENQQFDADFEEIMRRFGEDDKKFTGGEGGEPQPSIVDITQLVDEAASSPLLPPVEPSGPLTSGAMTGAMDAQDMLDISYDNMDDEESLLQGIQDIEDL
eukprot:TRINITY_DN31383_c0_g1_i2.p1 TRINITY_DN31383_c0_g1~~TRINITY_DN31383_c0_g1_i2.p1  ORF type:complete len:468 (-),score=90.69 TRINITY_DN31383_c0_g1_i2:49-1452(-)